jgi:hypothetical protein
MSSKLENLDQFILEKRICSKMISQFASLFPDMLVLEMHDALLFFLFSVCLCHFPLSCCLLKIKIIKIHPYRKRY